MSDAHAMVVASSHQVLTTHARSFSLASVFLSPERRNDAAVLYAFCREADDAVDEAPTRAAALRALESVETGLRHPGAGPAICAALHEVADRRGMDLTPAQQLIDGMRGDLDEVRLQSDRELIRYCYHAAGTVGLLMCAILGVHQRDALAHAVDLGVAMQLTNICRDVAEDAARGRVYLPEDRLRRAGTSSAALLAGTADREAVAAVVRDLLVLADAYYASADRGMRFIPGRPRLAIYVAARVYRAIGHRLRRTRQGDALAGRVFVPPFEKALLVCGATVLWLSSLLAGRGPGHTRSLHRDLDDLLPAPRR